MIPAIRKCLATAVVCTAITLGAVHEAEARPAPQAHPCDNIRGHLIHTPPPWGACFDRGVYVSMTPAAWLRLRLLGWAS